MMSRGVIVNRDNRTRHKKTKVIPADAKAILERFQTSISNILDHIKLYDLLLAKEQTALADDILRFQIVYLMSSLDFYFHELYSYGLLKMFQNKTEKTYRYREFRVPLKVVESALYDGENILRHLKETFIEINSTFTFMHPHRIKEVLNTISSIEVFDIVEKKLRKRNIIKHHEELEGIIEKIYRRRNKISHQTDIEHHTIVRNEISKKEVFRYVNIINEMVLEIHHLICED